MDTFPNNLLSMGQFSDADCMVAFTKTKVYVFDSTGSLVLDGFREKTGSRMWRFNVHAPHPHTAFQTSPSRNIYAPHIIPFDDDDDDDDEDDMPTTLPIAILQQSEAPSPPPTPLPIQSPPETPTQVSTTTTT